MGYQTAPTFGDLDGDGDLDVLAGEKLGNLLYFENTGTASAPAFSGPQTNPFGLADVGDFSTPTFADLDGDGDLDVLAGGLHGSLFYFKNIQNVVIPVELSAFTATLDAGAVLLRWQTESETNNAGFELHRLLPGGSGSFDLLGFIPGHGTTLEARHYAFRTDELAPGTHRFRLKQIDYDGGFEYSPTVEVVVGVPGSYALSSVYPNPFNPRASFTLAVQQAQRVEVTVYDVLGRRVAVLWEGAMAAGQAQALVVEGSAWTSGVYVIVAEGETFRAERTVTLLK